MRLRTHPVACKHMDPIAVWTGGDPASFGSGRARWEPRRGPAPPPPRRRPISRRVFENWSLSRLFLSEAGLRLSSKLVGLEDAGATGPDAMVGPSLAIRTVVARSISRAPLTPHSGQRSANRPNPPVVAGTDVFSNHVAKLFLKRCRGLSKGGPHARRGSGSTDTEGAGSTDNVSELRKGCRLTPNYQPTQGMWGEPSGIGSSPSCRGGVRGFTALT